MNSYEEAATMKAAQCSARLDGLNAKLAELRSRQAELQFELGSAGAEKIGEDDLDYLCGEVKRIILEGNPTERKRLVHALVEEIRVESKHAIHPRYRLPHSPVRELGGLVASAGLEPATRGLGNRPPPPELKSGSKDP